jgi:ParB family chromosome partitioning protein
MKEKEEKMHLPKVTIDDFFTNQEERDAQKLERVQKIRITQISSFPNHPFKVKDDEKMFETVESVKQHGVLVPAIVRPKEDGTYEMVSGHRRKRACELAQIEEIPCIVRNLTDDEATIIMVDSNLQREQIMPSERAFAYKMKLDAMKRQGQRNDLTCNQVGYKLDGKKSVEVLAEEIGESKSQIQRYIRLTYLIPELLKFVDNHYLKDKENMTMALAPAIEISYLSNNEQDMLLEAMETSLATPSTPQAKRLREESEKGTLNEETIQNILYEEKPNQKEQVKFTYDRVKKYFPKGYTIQQMEGVIEKLLQKYQIQWQNKQFER